MKITHRRDYREARKKEYPDVGEQLDALWEVLSTLALPKKARDIVDEIDRIKKKYPKA